VRKGGAVTRPFDMERFRVTDADMERERVAYEVRLAKMTPERRAAEIERRRRDLEAESWLEAYSDVPTGKA